MTVTGRRLCGCLLSTAGGLPTISRNLFAISSRLVSTCYVLTAPKTKKTLYDDMDLLLEALDKNKMYERDMKLFPESFKKKFKDHLEGMTPEKAAEVKPRLMPVTLESVEKYKRLSQYFSPYPQYKREEMEEPPPRVSPVVEELLRRRRADWDGDRWVPPRITRWKFVRERKKLIDQGHDFPPLPMRDRNLDVMPILRDKVEKREQKLKRVEENMKMMPQWVADFRERQKTELKEKERMKEKENALLEQLQILGLHPEEPSGKQMLQDMKKVDREQAKILQKQKK